MEKKNPWSSGLLQIGLSLSEPSGPWLWQIAAVSGPPSSPVQDPLEPIHDLPHLQALYAESLTMLFSTRLSFCVTSTAGSWFLCTAARPSTMGGKGGGTESHRFLLENQFPPA